MFGPQDERPPAEIPGRIPTDPNKRAGARDLRAHARLAAMMDKVAVIRTMVGAHGNHPRPVSALPATPTHLSPDQGGRPSLRGDSVQAPRGRSNRRCRRSSASHPRWDIIPGATPATRGYLRHGPLAVQPNSAARRSPPPRPALNLDLGRLGGRRTLQDELDTLRRQLESNEGRSAVWTRSPNGPSTSSAPASSSRPSTSARKTPSSARKYGLGRHEQ